MRKILPRTVCKCVYKNKSKCFALQEDKYCRILKDGNMRNGHCPFFKTTEQFKAGLRKYPIAPHMIAR